MGLRALLQLWQVKIQNNKRLLIHSTIKLLWLNYVSLDDSNHRDLNLSDFKTQCFVSTSVANIPKTKRMRGSLRIHLIRPLFVVMRVLFENYFISVVG